MAVTCLVGITVVYHSRCQILPWDTSKAIERLHCRNAMALYLSRAKRLVEKRPCKKCASEAVLSTYVIRMYHFETLYSALYLLSNVPNTVCSLKLQRVTKTCNRTTCRILHNLLLVLSVDGKLLKHGRR